MCLKLVLKMGFRVLSHQDTSENFSQKLWHRNRLRLADVPFIGVCVRGEISVDLRNGISGLSGCTLIFVIDVLTV